MTMSSQARTEPEPEPEPKPKPINRKVRYEALKAQMRDIIEKGYYGSNYGEDGVIYIEPQLNPSVISLFDEIQLGVIHADKLLYLYEKLRKEAVDPKYMGGLILKQGNPIRDHLFLMLRSVDPERHLWGVDEDKSKHVVVAASLRRIQFAILKKASKLKDNPLVKGILEVMGVSIRDLRRDLALSMSSAQLKIVVDRVFLLINKSFNSKAINYQRGLKVAVTDTRKEIDAAVINLNKIDYRIDGVVQEMPSINEEYKGNRALIGEISRSPVAASAEAEAESGAGAGSAGEGAPGPIPPRPTIADPTTASEPSQPAGQKGPTGFALVVRKLSDGGGVELRVLNVKATQTQTP